MDSASFEASSIDSSISDIPFENSFVSSVVWDNWVWIFSKLCSTSSNVWASILPSENVSCNKADNINNSDSNLGSSETPNASFNANPSNPSYKSLFLFVREYLRGISKESWSNRSEISSRVDSKLPSSTFIGMSTGSSDNSVSISFLDESNVPSSILTGIFNSVFVNSLIYVWSSTILSMARDKSSDKNSTLFESIFEIESFKFSTSVIASTTKDFKYSNCDVSVSVATFTFISLSAILFLLHY